MIAARLHKYHEPLAVEQIAEPEITGPHDVIVRLGGAGLCRTDLHIQEGQWAEKSGVELPYVLGHENAGWVHEIGSAVTNVEVGDTVIVPPARHLRPVPRLPRRRRRALREQPRSRASRRRRRFRRAAEDHARVGRRLEPTLHPKDIAALADAGLTAYHAVKKAVSILHPGTRAVVIGAGGLGHIGIQCLKAMTPAEIIVVDPSEQARALAGEIGADTPSRPTASTSTRSSR